MNPYREVFYQRQSEWYGIKSLTELQNKHQRRIPYYRWYTSEWLPDETTAPILDIACGAGQFVYFLKNEGFENVTGIDIDKQQVEMAVELGLNCYHADVFEFLANSQMMWAQISTLDLLEHLELGEMYKLLDLISEKMISGGRLILSVPNADSPIGLSTRYSDITHEMSFGVASMSEALFCHGLQCKAVLDPWPAPINLPRKIYRAIAMFGRRMESFRLMSLGLSAPRIWSPVFWMIAEKK